MSTLLCFEQTWVTDRNGKPVLYYTVLHCIALHWVTISTLLCFEQTWGTDRKGKPVLYCYYSRHKRFRAFHFPDRYRYDNNSCGNMAAYELKISSYSTSGRHCLYDICNFANRVFILPHVQLVLYKKIFQYLCCLFCFWCDSVFLSLASLISKFFELYANIKVKYKQIETPLTSTNTKSLYSQFYVFLHYFLLSYVPFVSRSLVVYLMDIFGPRHR